MKRYVLLIALTFLLPQIALGQESPPIQCSLDSESIRFDNPTEQTYRVHMLFFFWTLPADRWSGSPGSIVLKPHQVTEVRIADIISNLPTRQKNTLPTTVAFSVIDDSETYKLCYFLRDEANQYARDTRISQQLTDMIQEIPGYMNPPK